MKPFIILLIILSTFVIGIIITLTPDYKSDTLVLIPTLTANAYSEGGFYDYFEGRCGVECLTISLDENPNHNYSSSSNGIILLLDKGYDYISDSSNDVISQLNNYDTIIILHNEYVTRELFDGITNHPNVFYLYPNALYGEVIIETDPIRITLLSGHGVNGKDNAFDWEFDNTRPDEFDNECLTAQWFKVDNGYQLNCYPENAIMQMDWIIQFIEDNK